MTRGLNGHFLTSSRGVFSVKEINHIFQRLQTTIMNIHHHPSPADSNQHPRNASNPLHADANRRIEEFYPLDGDCASTVAVGNLVQCSRTSSTIRPLEQEEAFLGANQVSQEVARMPVLPRKVDLLLLAVLFISAGEQ